MSTTRAARALPAAVRADEQARVAALAELRLLDTGSEERFDRVTRLAADLFGVAASVNFLSDDRQFAKSTAGGLVLQGAVLPRHESICTVTIAEDRTLVVEDLSKDDRFKSLGLVTEDPHLRFYAGQPITTRSGHRVGSLCVYGPSPRPFSEQDERLLRDLAAWVQLEITVKEELDSAQQVQRALLPRTTVAVPGIDLAGGCLPARGVSGDFFDWQRHGDGATFTVADVMGKGAGAAILAATVRAALRAARGLAPAEAVAAAASTLACDLEEAGSFVTLLHGRIQTDGLVEYADAGHGLAAVVRSDGSVERLVSDGRPVGMFAGDSWTGATVQLEPDDTLLVGSDGVLDLLDPSRPALDQIAEVARRGTAQQIVQHVLDLAEQAHATDDTTILVLRRPSETPGGTLTGAHLPGLYGTTVPAPAGTQEKERRA
jgi:hypothetical protein